MTDRPLIPSKGWGPFRAEFYSFCSKLNCRPGCPRCAAGSWENVWKRRLDSTVYRRWYRLWFWWHNRPNSKSRETIERYFPNLRRSVPLPPKEGPE